MVEAFAHDVIVHRVGEKDDDSSLVKLVVVLGTVQNFVGVVIRIRGAE